MIYIIVIVVLLIIFFLRRSPVPDNEQSTNFSDKIKNAENSTNSVQFSVSFPHKQSDEDRRIMAELEEKYPKWHGGEKIRGICFEREKIDPLPEGKNEIVYYKTDRYAELFGRGKDVSYFPGYGKIYNRSFEIWYRKTGSKNKEGLMKHHDIGIIDKDYGPFFIEKITGGRIFNNRLERTSGYLKLYNIRDDKNGLTWYAGLKDAEFTGITTEGENE